MSDKEFDVIEKYWDNRAYSFDKDHDTEIISKWKEILTELLGEDRRKTVLDLGTGSGFLANMTAQLGYPSVGMDLSVEMMRNGVRHAEESMSPAFFIKGNAIELPLLDNSVDFIINARLIWTIIEPDNMLREWIRVIKPGGKVMCFNRMDAQEGLTAGKWSEGFIYEEDVDKKLSVQNASMDELEALFTNAGYVDVEIRRLPGLTRPEFADLQDWYVVIASKPLSRRYAEAAGMARFWNDASETYEENHALSNHQIWEKVLRTLIGEPAHKQIIDVGTGTGMIANMLYEAGYSNVVGVDLSEKMMRVAIDHAREQNADIRFIYGNAMELPFEDNSADVIISSRLLWTLTEPEEAIREWMRVLKPGGKLIAINEMEECGIYCPSIERYAKDIDAKELPFSNATEEEIKDVIKKAGFHDVERTHMKGCHMVKSNCENWYAFTAIK